MLTKCDQCRAAYNERTPPQEPPCQGCWIDLKLENRQAAEIFNMVRNQFIIAGMGGQIIDLNLSTVIEAMKIYPETINDPWECLAKIRYAFNETVIKKQEESNNKG